MAYLTVGADMVGLEAKSLLGMVPTAVVFMVMVVVSEVSNPLSRIASPGRTGLRSTTSTTRVLLPLPQLALQLRRHRRRGAGT